MSTKKRFLALILAVLLILSLAGCETARGDTVDIPASQTGDTDFQKNMHQSPGQGDQEGHYRVQQAGVSARG